MEEKLTVFPRVADNWMANFLSKLESCVKQPLQPEVLGLGEVPPRVADIWIESCVKQPLQPEVLGLGEVPPLGVLHGVVQQLGVLGLGLGVVQAVKEKSREIWKESFVSLASIEKKFSMRYINNLSWQPGSSILIFMVSK